MGKKKTSIGTWAYIWGGYKEAPIAFDVVLDRLQELKFDGIEFGAFPPHFEANTDAARKKIRKALAERGLGVSGIAAPTPSPATARKSEYLDAIKANLDLCSEIGSPKLRVDTVDPPTSIPGGMDYTTCFAKVADLWNATAEECAKRNVKLIWEFEPGFLFNKPSEVVRLTYKVDHPNFSVLFDSCHAHMCGVLASRQMGATEVLPGGVVQFAHMLTGKIGHIHLIDSDGTLHGNETSTHAPLGTGVLDFSKILPAIIEAGYTDEWWPVDLCFWPNALDVTADNKTMVDKLISRYA